MNWKRYNTHVRVGDLAAGGVVLPITTLEVTAEPWTGTGSLITELFDGRRVLEGVGWGYRAVLTWDELRTDHDKLRIAIQYLLDSQGADVYIGWNETNGSWEGLLPACLPDLSGDELKAIWQNRARRRSGNLTLVTSSQQLGLYEWLTDKLPNPAT